ADAPTFRSPSCVRADVGACASVHATLRFPAWLLAPRLTGFAPDHLAGVANTLSFIWLRRTKTAELRRDLSDECLVGTGDHDLRRLGRRELDARRRTKLDRVREAERQLQPVRTNLGLVADARDLELLLITLPHAFHHVVDERPREAVERLVVRLVRRALDVDHIVGPVHADASRKTMRQLALRSFHLPRVCLDRHRDPAGDRDGKLSNSRHDFRPPTRPRRRARRRFGTGALRGPTSAPCWC